MLFNTVLFTGNANPALAQEIASHLGIELGRAKVGRFSDGEVAIEIEQNVRARDIFVVQPTCAPTNENLMELCIMVDALKRASARRVTAVIPYFGYARQDRKVAPRTPITSKLVADLITAAKLGGEVAFVLVDGKSGDVLDSRNPDLPLPPASVAKTVTSLFALEKLGAGFRFKTRVLATGPVSGGIVQGDLVLVGGGDPTLQTDQLGDLVARLAATMRSRASAASRCAAASAAASLRNASSAAR
mgnify:CR=1 FL=1